MHRSRDVIAAGCCSSVMRKLCHSGADEAAGRTVVGAGRHIDDPGDRVGGALGRRATVSHALRRHVAVRCVSLS